MGLPVQARAEVSPYRWGREGSFLVTRRTQWDSSEPGDHRLKMDIYLCIFFLQKKRWFSSSHGKTEWATLTACFPGQSALSPRGQFSVIKTVSWTYCTKLLPFILNSSLGPSLFSHINCIKTSVCVSSFCLSFMMENFQHIQNDTQWNQTP